MPAHRIEQLLALGPGFQRQRAAIEDELHGSGRRGIHQDPIVAYLGRRQISRCGILGQLELADIGAVRIERLGLKDARFAQLRSAEAGLLTNSPDARISATTVPATKGRTITASP
jgi:hypothetical protein